MKKLAFAALALLTSLVATPAHAIYVTANINDDITDVVVDNKFTYGANGKTVSVFYEGTLAAMSKVVIEYSLLGAPTPAANKPAATLSSLGYSLGEDPLYEAEAVVKVGDDQAVYTDGLVTAMAHLPNYQGGTATIINNSADPIGFHAYLSAFLTSAVSLVAKVTVTSVPLPAALPLFGLGVASLAAYRSRKKAAA